MNNVSLIIVCKVTNKIRNTHIFLHFFSLIEKIVTIQAAYEDWWALGFSKCHRMGRNASKVSFFVSPMWRRNLEMDAALGCTFRAFREGKKWGVRVAVALLPGCGGTITGLRWHYYRVMVALLQTKKAMKSCLLRGR